MNSPRTNRVTLTLDLDSAVPVHDALAGLIAAPGSADSHSRPYCNGGGTPQAFEELVGRVMGLSTAYIEREASREESRYVMLPNALEEAAERIRRRGKARRYVR